MSFVTLRILRMSMIVVKEFTQPVKKVFINIAKRSELFRKFICKPPAHCYNWCEYYLLRLLAKDEKFIALNEEEAIELGSAIWAEIVVFVGCSKVLLVETELFSKKESPEQIRKNSDEDLWKAMNILQQRLDRQYLYIEKIRKALEELGVTIEGKQIKEKEHKIDWNFVEKLA